MAANRDEDDRFNFDEYIEENVEKLQDSVAAEERQRTTRALINSVNRVISRKKSSKDTRCCFRNSRTGERCYEAKGKFRVNGKVYESMYCTTSGKNHRLYVKNQNRRSQARRNNSRAPRRNEFEDDEDFVVNDEDPLSEVEFSEEEEEEPLHRSPGRPVFSAAPVAPPVAPVAPVAQVAPVAPVAQMPRVPNLIDLTNDVDDLIDLTHDCPMPDAPDRAPGPSEMNTQDYKEWAAQIVNEMPPEMLSRLTSDVPPQAPPSSDHL